MQFTKLFSTKLQRFIIALLTVTLLSACGDSSSNNQGISFTFIGWYEDSAGALGLASLSTPIAGVNPEEFGFDNDVLGYAGVQNNLVDQFIRLERIEHEYLVPGGSIDIPSSSVSIPGTLGPSPTSNSSVSIDSSLPGGADSIGNTGYFGALIVPRSVREFIALNRSNLPEPPFVMVVSSKATGVTSAGHRLTSNAIEIDVIIEPEIIIEPPNAEEEDDNAGALENDNITELETTNKESDDSVDNIFSDGQG